MTTANRIRELNSSRNGNPFYGNESEKEEADKLKSRLSTHLWLHPELDNVNADFLRYQLGEKLSLPVIKRRQPMYKIILTQFVEHSGLSASLPAWCIWHEIRHYTGLSRNMFTLCMNDLIQSDWIYKVPVIHKGRDGNDAPGFRYALNLERALWFADNPDTKLFMERETNNEQVS